MEQKQQLTPQQAIQVLYQVTGEIALKRADNEMVIQALQVINATLPQEAKDTE